MEAVQEARQYLIPFPSTKHSHLLFLSQFLNPILLITHLFKQISHVERMTLDLCLLHWFPYNFFQMEWQILNVILNKLVFFFFFVAGKYYNFCHICLIIFVSKYVTRHLRLKVCLVSDITLTHMVTFNYF